MLNRPSDSGAFSVVPLAEWSTATGKDVAALRNVSLRDDPRARQIADAVRNCVDIREDYDGLAIVAGSWVGRIDVGRLRIVIHPKLPALPLTNLLRYAYSLRDVSLFEEVEASSASGGFQDLLIHMLAAEVDELQRRGLARQYVRAQGALGSPRGRILMDELAHAAVYAEATLPCEYFERRADWYLNQAISGGLTHAAYVTTDRDLRRRVLRLVEAFGEGAREIRLDAALLDRAERGLTRLTAAYAPALTLIGLLLQQSGIAFDSHREVHRLPGFLFDMNVFFQRLLSRFLRENVLDYGVEDERQIRQVFSYSVNPRNRPAPKPRPDFALLSGSSVATYLDAKYRDAWNKGVPAEWLYQLSIYSYAAPHRSAVLLYATTTEDARDEELTIRPPSGRSHEHHALVVIRPVNLLYLARLVEPRASHALAGERSAYANKLVAIRHLPLSRGTPP